MRSKNEVGELALLDKIRRRIGRAGSGVQLGIGDDCALLRPRPGEDLAVTTDLSIDGRHFKLDWHSPQTVGHRTLARGLSDLAAMGARPIATFLSLGLPPELVQNTKRRSSAWIDLFYDGFLALAGKHKTLLAGGDLAQSPIAVADIVLIGAVRRGHALLRSGARPNDLLYVTGKLGGAVAGFTKLAKLASARAARHSTTGLKVPARLATALQPHLFPQPRIEQGLWLVRHQVATAALDLSDGLSTDLHHLCDESNVAAEVDVTALPLFPDTTVEQALHGGEDYELLFTASRAKRVPSAILGIPVTCIGHIVKRQQSKPTVTLLTPQGAESLERRGWEHFS
jgi:thiamine-monophosphate kinase